jgi:hypothetical protein
MRVTGNTPDRVKNIYIQGSQNFSTYHFDDSQGPPKDGIWFHVQGSSGAGDAETPSVAREAAVSFSPPPRQAPPRPSNDHRKRKETEPDLGDDDDDFVSVPPIPSASSSKAPKVAVRNIKKSKSSNAGPQHSEVIYNAFICGSMLHTFRYGFIYYRCLYDSDVVSLLSFSYSDREVLL